MNCSRWKTFLLLLPPFERKRKYLKNGKKEKKGKTSLGRESNHFSNFTLSLSVTPSLVISLFFSRWNWFKVTKEKGVLTLSLSRERIERMDGIDGKEWKRRESFIYFHLLLLPLLLASCKWFATLYFFFLFSIHFSHLFILCTNFFLLVHLFNTFYCYKHTHFFSLLKEAKETNQSKEKWFVFSSFSLLFIQTMEMMMTRIVMERMEKGNDWTFENLPMVPGFEAGHRL